jgi:isopentenyldiphosphate isomerase
MELLDVVDENGVPTGEIISREKAHRTGVRHRTSHVWLVRRHEGSYQLLLQKRSAQKETYPGCYDISSAGHIPAGDGYVESALRELEEELGMQAAPEELTYIGTRRFTIRDMFRGKLYLDVQVSNVYLLFRDTEAELFTVQEAELESVLWMDMDECVHMVKTASPPNCVQMEELEMIARCLKQL